MNCPYLKQTTFFSPNEKEFYFNLRKLADSKGLVIFAKVRLADLIWVPKSYKNFWDLFNKIKGKHIDFVLCNPETFEIKCLIELDDKTHNLPSRKSRDYFVNKVIQKSGHKFIRCNIKQHNCIEL